jgi:hypothetical protein
VIRRNGRTIASSSKELLAKACKNSRSSGSETADGLQPRAPPATVTKDAPAKFSCWSFYGSGERSALAEALPQPSGLGNPS